MEHIPSDRNALEDQFNSSMSRDVQKETPNPSRKEDRSESVPFSTASPIMESKPSSISIENNPKDTSHTNARLLNNTQHTLISTNAVSKPPSVVDNILNQIEHCLHVTRQYIQKIFGNDALDTTNLGDIRDESSLNEDSDNRSIHVMFFIGSTLTLTPFGQTFCKYFLNSIVYFVLTVVGTALGIGVGVGFASFVKEKLDHLDSANLNDDHDDSSIHHTHLGTAQSPPTKNANSTAVTSAIRSLASPNVHTQLNHDTNSYVALMTSAGYATHTHITLNAIDNNVPTNTTTSHSHDAISNLKGQILKNVAHSQIQNLTYISKPYGERNCIYTYPTGESDLHVSGSKGIATFMRLWPNLPKDVIHEIGKLEDYIARDYIMSWYASVDDSIRYENEVERRKRLQFETETYDADASDHIQNRVASIVVKQQTIVEPTPPVVPTTSQNSTMLLSTSTCRSSPFIEILYTSLTSVLGNFATLCENVNITKLVLVKFLNILKLNIRTYRDIRKNVLEKDRKLEKATSSGLKVGGGNGSTNRTITCPSEIAIVREYLIQGKFHKAITFGLDVPSLLFGDAKGRDCPIPSSHLDVAVDFEGDSTQYEIEEDEVLYQRLFGNNRRVLHECELDYNRVIAHRLARILLPRADFASPLLRSASVEMLASCVLTPSMGCFTPDYVNGWIVKGLDTKNLTHTNKDEKISSETKVTSINGQNIPSSESSEPCRKKSIDEDYTDLVDEILDDDDDNDYNYELDDTTSSLPESARMSDTIDDTEDHQKSDVGNEILSLLAMSLIELQAYVDFDEAREAQRKGEELGIRWTEKGCVETVRNLVLVIEATIMHGVLSKKRLIRKAVHGTDVSMEDTESGTTASMTSSLDIVNKYGSLIVLLMEVTSDLDSFEKEVKKVQNLNSNSDVFKEDEHDVSSLEMPNADDLSTLRTLIAAWLHNGTIYRTLFVLMKAGDNVLQPFYHKNAFIRQSEYVEAFLRQLRSLHNVVILVDTMTVLSSESLRLYQSENDASMPEQSGTKLFPAASSNITNSSSNEDLNEYDVKVRNFSPAALQSTLKSRLQKHDSRNIISLGNQFGTSLRSNFDSNRKRIMRIGNKLDSHPIKLNSSPLSGQQHSNSHLDFRRNESFASNLRIERNARMESFEKSKSSSTSRIHVEMICRSHVASHNHFTEHRDLHAMAKSFYYNTNMITLKHVKPNDSSNEQTMLLFESVTGKRKLEIPDDDSSFLLRAQPRPLSVVNIHRDERSYNLSYKKYVAYFEEPIMNKNSSSFLGAKLRKRCFLRYYPSDRTAAVNFIRSDRCLDPTLGRLIDIENSGDSKQLKEFERYLCNKFIKKGSERGGSLAASLLTSTVMDSNDFNAIPRTGKAFDFVYRISLYEEPEIELAGKRFVVQDASVLGAHQADASSLELSDAALSTALVLGEKIEKKHTKHFHVKCGADGYPMAYFRVTEQQNETGSPLAKAQAQSKQGTAFRAYRLSFLRASLLVQSSRREAQLQCLLSGSAKTASKAKIDNLLQGTLTLLDHATSKTRGKQSLLLRDLKLGINHIDRDQLRRNGLLNPRYPTKLHQLKAVVESSVEVKTPGQNIDLLVTPTTVLYQIRCTAITEYIGCYDYDNADEIDLKYGDLIREEWVVLRPFKDFNMLHKFLKSQVNPSESSAGAGAKLVGAAQGLTAALTLGAPSIPTDAKRKSLMPSLNQAVKAGALGNTKKSIEKRKEILNGYLQHLLSAGNLLNRCPELLRFLGAHDPFPNNVKINQGMIEGFTDGLGRREMKRSLFRASVPRTSDLDMSTAHIQSIEQDSDLLSQAQMKKTEPPSSRKNRKRMKNNDPARVAMLSAIKSRIETVKLSQVRGCVFEMIRFTFDLDNNANFFRSHMVTALKTMTIAFTSAHSFKRILLDFHLRYVNGKNVAYWIKYIRNLIWPNGVLFTSASPLSKEESEALANKSKILLQEAFPEQLATVLGNEITESGLNMIHEMLQNRLVLKSICYMMYDELINEIMPEMGDILTSHQVLDRG